MKSKVLFIVEGKKTEPKILKHDLLPLIDFDSNYEIISICNPIYELYKAYKNEEYNDLPSLISYLRTKKKLNIDSNILSKNAFSSIYLIFDYEPHYQKYSDETIIDLLNTFNNETELGKLYINYPMIEAFYHLKEIPDNDYIKRKISLKDLKYKELVAKESSLKRNSLSKKALGYIVKENYNKAKLITKSKTKEINHLDILEVEINLKNTKQEIYVLSTLPLILFDYNYDLTVKKLNNILEL